MTPMLLRARLLSRCMMLVTGLVVAVNAVAGVAAEKPRASAGAAAQTTPVPVVPRKTREELIREWDINSDGKIEIGEAEVAASRMRLERATMRLNSGFDPVTGRPRGEPEPVEEPVEDEEPDADLAAELDAATQEARPKPTPRTTTSGTPPVTGSGRCVGNRAALLVGGSAQPQCGPATDHHTAVGHAAATQRRGQRPTGRRRAAWPRAGGPGHRCVDPAATRRALASSATSAAAAIP